LKTIVFIRHAKSSWKNPELTDIERPLNKRGKRNAPEMALRLKKTGIYPDLILSSSAVRTMMTATYFAEIIGYPIPKIQQSNQIYEAAVEDVFEVIESLSDEFESILVFGHNPTFTRIANRFSDQIIPNVPTAGMFAVQFETDEWRNTFDCKANFLFFDFPKRTEA
jgi:phosphohistidine phosphatase